MDGQRFAEIARAAFGKGRRPAGVERLRGGSKKGVYRLSFDDDGPGAIVYVWSEEEDFWPVASNADPETPFGHASGLRFFEAAHGRLSGLGVRVPEVYLVDRPGDVVVVEDVRGGTLEALLRDDPTRAGRVMDRLAASLVAMGRERAPWVGKIEGTRRPSAVEVVLEQALRDLDEAAVRVERIGAVREDFESALREMAAGVRPRADYGLIHGELGPDHVLVDDHDVPVLIDLEGTMFFDAEWEHVFLRIRFHEHYERLRVDGLDEGRMRLYALAQHLSLTAGPLRLLDGDFPDREFMLGISKFHSGEALEFLAKGR
ncbi:phosphotransferase family protein [Nonomuraea sp. NPDC050451]|uniref:phosphotransferase family protein n=1 Tax=Nonomuraea sp. NPDC050451 TaxID=3364364 RepID=UPI00378EEA51